MSDSHENLGRAIRSIDREVEKARKVKDLLESMDETDPESLMLSIESETNLPEVLSGLYDAILEHDIYLAGLKAKLEDLSERKRRVEKTIDTLKGVIFLSMEKAELPQLRHPCATISTRSTPPKVIIEDEAAVPSEYWKRPDPVLDTAKIKEALDGKTIVPGCVLSNGGRALTIRVK